MTRDEFENLKPGDLIRHRGEGIRAALVTEHFGTRAVAVETFDVTNPAEWDIIAKAQHVFPRRSAMDEILAEGQRQIDVEGFDADHDDGHIDGELLTAATIYYRHATMGDTVTVRDDGTPMGWPWDRKWWKPKGRRRDLIRAGALCLAEKNRLNRIGHTTDHVEQKLDLIVEALERTP